MERTTRSVPLSVLNCHEDNNLSFRKVLAKHNKSLWKEHLGFPKFPTMRVAAERDCLGFLPVRMDGMELPPVVFLPQTECGGVSKKRREPQSGEANSPVGVLLLGVSQSTQLWFVSRSYRSRTRIVKWTYYKTPLAEWGSIPFIRRGCSIETQFFYHLNLQINRVTCDWKCDGIFL